MFKMFVFLSQYNSPVVVVLATELPRDIVAQMYNLVALLEIHSRMGERDKTGISNIASQ